MMWRMWRKGSPDSNRGVDSGFTLMEAVLVVALFGILMVAITEFFFGSNQIYQTQNAELGINYSARQALDDIDTFVRQAVQVVGTFGTYNSGPTTLILEVQSVNSSNQLIPGVYDTILFNLSGSSLYREIFPGLGSVRPAGMRLIGSDISSLAFTYNDANFAQVDLVSTSMDIIKTSGRSTQVITISSQSHLRN